MKPARASSPLVVDLWPGTPPGDVGIEGPESTRVHQSRFRGVGSTRLITNVTRPTLTVHLPRPAESSGTAMVICPGGGYHDLFWELEGEEVAAWLTSVGIAGIILKYRVPRRPGESMAVPPLGPQLDAQRAISAVRSRAAEWGIDPGRIGMVGFSVGGHLCAATATGFGKRKYEPVDAADRASPRPDFAVLCYSGFLKADGWDEIWPGLLTPADTPPIFLVHASDDSEASVENSVIMYLALKRAGLPVELHVFAKGEHDFGVRKGGGFPSSWTDLCLAFLANHGLYRKP